MDRALETKTMEQFGLDRYLLNKHFTAPEIKALETGDISESLEEKVRRVRTAAGVRWFKRPVGSPIKGSSKIKIADLVHDLAEGDLKGDKKIIRNIDTPRLRKMYDEAYKGKYADLGAQIEEELDRRGVSRQPVGARTKPKPDKSKPSLRSEDVRGASAKKPTPRPKASKPNPKEFDRGDDWGINDLDKASGKQGEDMLLGASPKHLRKMYDEAGERERIAKNAGDRDNEERWRELRDIISQQIVQIDELRSKDPGWSPPGETRKPSAPSASKPAPKRGKSRMVAVANLKPGDRVWSQEAGPDFMAKVVKTQVTPKGRITIYLDDGSRVTRMPNERWGVVEQKK